MRSPERLVIFSRAPVAGRVKTRLRVGPEAAALQAAFLEDVCRLSRGVSERVLAVDDVEDPIIREIARAEGIARVAQAAGDLGVRMVAAIAEGLDRAERVGIIGSDSPTLPPAHLMRAFALLDGADVVLGPAEDGGFWFIGARRPLPPLDGIAWGTDAALSSTVERLDGLRVALADRFWDVDQPADLDRLARELVADPEIAPATRRALARL